MSFEPKKLALLRILQILEEKTDADHHLTQQMIADELRCRYGIDLERKAVGRDLQLLKDADIDIGSDRTGFYLVSRRFEDSELHLLVDSVLSSRHITQKHSAELIDRLCGLASEHFRRNVRYIHSTNEVDKSENQQLFLNIELIDEAIEKGLRIQYDYNKYGTDRKLHRTSTQVVSPYRMILHNQRYYLMAYCEHWKNIVYHRLDHITKMKVRDDAATPLKSLPGFANGIDFNAISSAMPYMYTDKKETVEFTADEGIVDQIVDWFGSTAKMRPGAVKGTVDVTIETSPKAMVHWATQYVNYVEVKKPERLRKEIREILEKASKKYQ
ncbi:MAG: WYL domain-containing protein [Clostridia bacterium]|nr:WYL domain-containing protein [Clostridia bacterium]